MKKCLIISLILLSNLCYSQAPDNYKEIDSLVHLQSEKILDLENFNDSLIVEISNMNNGIAENRVAREFYNMNITSLIAIISLLVIVAIYILGFIVPKIQEKKYSTLINDLEKLKTKLKDQSKRTDSALARTMFHNFHNVKNYKIAIIWAIRHLDRQAKFRADSDDFDDFMREIAIPMATSTLDKITSIKMNQEYFTEMNKILIDLIVQLKSKNYNSKINEIYVEFNKKVSNEDDGKSKSK